MRDPLLLRRGASTAAPWVSLSSGPSRLGSAARDAEGLCGPLTWRGERPEARRGAAAKGGGVGATAGPGCGGGGGGPGGRGGGGSDSLN